MRLTLTTVKGQFTIQLEHRDAEWCAVVSGELSAPHAFGSSTTAGHYGPVEIFGKCPTDLTGRAIRHVEFMAGDILRWEMGSAEQGASAGEHPKASEIPTSVDFLFGLLRKKNPPD